ncbi:hypothetical protein Tco_1389833 [Tanacetum coccineum]
MQEPKKPPKNPRKAHIQMDEELAMRLHEEEKAALERMQRDRAVQEEESNAALTVEFDDVQARMDADALFTYNQLKNKSLQEIQKLYEREQKWINDFVPMDSKMVKDSGKKDNDSGCEISNSDGSSKFYKVFSTMLEEFDRQDLFDLHRLVMKRFEFVAPKGFDLILWGDLKTMIEPNKEDEV